MAKKATNAWVFLLYALIAYGIVFLDVAQVKFYQILGLPAYGSTLSATLRGNITAIVLWGVLQIVLITASRKFTDFDVLSFRGKPSAGSWTAIAVLSAVYIFVITAAWGWQFKPLAELQVAIEKFQSGGVPQWIVQIIYYAFETLGFFLIIAFSQHFGEKLFKNDKIPYGGIACGLTWGLTHILTKDLAVGLISLGFGIIFGVIYMLTRKNPRVAIPLLWALFVI